MELFVLNVIWELTAAQLVAESVRIVLTGATASHLEALGVSLVYPGIPPNLREVFHHMTVFLVYLAGITRGGLKRTTTSATFPTKPLVFCALGENTVAQTQSLSVNIVHPGMSPDKRAALHQMIVLLVPLAGIATSVIVLGVTQVESVTR